MTRGILRQIRFCEIQKRDRRFQPFFLQVDEGPRELDEALVKAIILRLFAVGQPEGLEYIVSLKKLLAVETGKIAEVVTVKVAWQGLYDQLGDSTGFFAHERRGYPLQDVNQPGSGGSVTRESGKQALNSPRSNGLDGH